MRRRYETVAPNGHFFSPVAGNLISPIDYSVYRIERKHTFIFLCEQCQIRRTCLQFFADWSVTLCIHGVARRAVTLVLNFADINILSQCVRTEAHGSDNEGDRFHHLVLCWCLRAVAHVDIRVDLRQYPFPLIVEISGPLEASRVPAPP